MRLSKDYLYRKIGNKNILIPCGQNIVDCHNMLEINDVAAFIVNELQEENTLEQLIVRFTEEYEFDEGDLSVAERDIKAFLKRANEMNIIELEVGETLV